MNLEYYSSAALVTSVVVYLLAMIAHAAEWAAARKAPVEEPPTGGAGRGRGSRRRHDSVGRGVVGRAVVGCADADAAVEQRMAEMKVEQFGRIGVALTVVGFLLQRRRRRAPRSGRRPAAVGQHVRVHHHRDGVGGRPSTW